MTANPYNIPTREEVAKWIEPPASILELVKQDDKNSEKFELPEIIKDGERKITLFKNAASLRAQGYEIHEIRAALWGIVPRCENSEDVKEADIEDILRSVSKYDKGQSVPLPVPSSLEPQQPSESDTADKDSKDPYVIALGLSGDKYYFTSSSNRQIVCVSASNFSLNSLLNLQPYEYWQEKFPKTNKADSPPDIGKIASFLMRKAREKGIFAVGNLRGRGVWNDKRRTVLHCGDSVIDLQSKRSYELGRFETNYIYELGQSYIPSFSEDRDPKDLLGLTKTFRWKSKNAPYILTGWIIAAQFSGWQRWRPHIWVTGQKGTGKSTVINEFIKTLLGPRSYFFEGGSTAAGIRQEIKCDSLPVIFDEAETSDQKTGAKIKSILELARQASSDSDGYICKGTPSGSGLKYKMSSCFCLASIRVNLQEEQDKSRFAVIELSPGTTDNWPEVSSMLNNLDVVDGERIFTKMAGLLSEYEANIKYVTSEMAKMGLERRFCDQYGTLFASCLTYQHGKKIGEVEFAELIVNTNFDELLSSAEADCSDSDDCLSTILKSKTNCRDASGRALTIGGIIMKIKSKEAGGFYTEELGTYGMAVKGDKLFIADKNPELAKLLRDTQWGNQLWKSSLLRLKGSEHKPLRVGGVWGRGVLVDVDVRADEPVPFGDD